MDVSHSSLPVQRPLAHCNGTHLSRCNTLIPHCNAALQHLVPRNATQSPPGAMLSCPPLRRNAPLPLQLSPLLVQCSLALHCDAMHLSRCNTLVLRCNAALQRFSFLAMQLSSPSRCNALLPSIATQRTSPIATLLSSGAMQRCNVSRSSQCNSALPPGAMLSCPLQRNAPLPLQHSRPPVQRPLAPLQRSVAIFLVPRNATQLPPGATLSCPPLQRHAPLPLQHSHPPLQCLQCPSFLAMQLSPLLVQRSLALHCNAAQLSCCNMLSHPSCNTSRPPCNALPSVLQHPVCLEHAYSYCNTTSSRYLTADLDPPTHRDYQFVNNS